MNIVLDDATRAVLERAQADLVAATAAKYSLAVLGDECLRKPTRVLKSAEDVDVAVVDAMNRMLVQYEGLGLAAPQVGSDLRICLARLSIHKGQTALFINPTIVGRSETTELKVNEGCLSVPIDKSGKSSFRTSTQRHVWVDVDHTQFTPDGKTLRHRLKLRGLDAQIMQHECDHLDGQCIFDALPRQQRRAAERGVAKWVEANRR